MWDISGVKARGREAFKANYWPCVAVAFVYTLLLGGGAAGSASQQASSAGTVTLGDEQAIALIVAVPAAVAVSLLVKVFLVNPIEVGTARFFSSNVERPGARFAVVGEGFGDYGHVLVTLLLRDALVLLWSPLLVAPGVMRAYSYRLAPYIVKDRPDLPAGEVLGRSAGLMRGNRWRAFLLDLSFLGWHLLGLLTLGLAGVFWTMPYARSADAALYRELMGR